MFKSPSRSSLPFPFLRFRFSPNPLNTSHISNLKPNPVRHPLPDGNFRSRAVLLGECAVVVDIVAARQLLNHVTAELTPSLPDEPPSRVQNTQSWRRLTGHNLALCWCQPEQSSRRLMKWRIKFTYVVKRVYWCLLVFLLSITRRPDRSPATLWNQRHCVAPSRYAQCDVGAAQRL